MEKIIGMIHKEQVEMRKDIKKLIGDVAGLKVKAGIWGLLGGSIPIIIIAILAYLTKGNL